MARIYQLLIVLLLVALLAPAGTALAQNGACPPGSFQLTGPGGPVGTVPHDMLVCAYDAYDHVAALDDPHDYYPCDQVVYHYEPDLQWLNQTLVHSFNWVPPTDYHYGQFIRVRFLVFQYMSVASSPDLIWSFDSYELQLQMYDSALRETSNQIRQLGQFQKVTTFRVVSDFFGTHRYYYDVYVVDLYIYQGDSAEPRGGYLRLRLHPRPDEQNPNPLSPNLLGWAMSSMQFGNADDVFPEHCPIPNATLPIIPPVATPTAYPPTWTPVPGATTAPTPMTTPWPTATGLATAYPTYTPTPLIFPTTQSEITPTPWQPVTLPTIAWPTPKPTILWAGLPGGGEGGEGGEGGGGVGGALLEMLDGVKDSLEAPTGELQELASLDAWTPTEPGDGPLSPDNTLFEMVSLVTLPFSYLMGLRALMPNLAPWLTFFVSLAGLVIFQVVIKLALNAATFTFELIRRIWEAIPLN